MKSIFAGLIFTLIGSVAWAHEGHDHQMIAHLVFPTNGVHAHLYWGQEPDIDGEAILQVEFRRPSDHGLTDIEADLSVRAHMPDMNHGDVPTAPPVQIKDDNGQLVTGTYSVAGIYLYMGGKWEITLTLTSADGSEESQTFEYQMDGDGHHH